MVAETAALISFVIITTFTPGPNNITSASMGLNYGYRRTLRYMLGIFSGFFLLMLLCAMLSETLLMIAPDIHKILSLAGSLYILWLAWHILSSDYKVNENERKILGFANGIFLQLFNPKVLIYGLTIYSTFLKDLKLLSFMLPFSAFVLAITSFVSISLWTIFSMVIRRFMKRILLRKIINGIFSFMLVLTAINLSGIMDFIK